MKSDNKLFYGWYIALMGMLLNMTGIGVIGIQGIFFSDISSTLNTSQAQVSMLITFITLGMIVASVLSNKILALLGIRKAVLTFGLAEAVALIIMGMSSSIYMMYIAATITGFAIFLCCAVTVPALITNWFTKKRGTAMGLGMAGLGLSNALLTPYLAPVIAREGFGTGFLHLGIIVSIVTAIAFIVIRDTPEEKGLTALTDDDKNSSSKQAETGQEEFGLTLKEAKQTPAFWGFVLFCFTTFYAATGILIQAASYFNYLELDARTIGTTFSALGICSILGKLFIGVIYDKFGLYKSNIFLFGLMALTIAGLQMAPSILGMGLFALLAGTGFAFNTIAGPLMVPHLFGKKHAAQILPVYMMTASLSGMVFALVSGMIIDNFGFNTVLNIGFLFTLAGLGFSCFCIKSAEKHEQSFARTALN